MAKSSKEYPTGGEMHDPPHPGELLRDTLIDALGLTVTEAAARLDVDRKTLSRILNGRAAITVEMALRLSKALDTSSRLWLGMQQSYDLWQAKQKKTPDLSRIERLTPDMDGHAGM